MSTRTSALLVVICLCAALGATAVDRGRITGVVVDTAGLPKAGVTVQLTGPLTRRALTNPRGEFAFDVLPPGTYQLSFVLTGFSAASQTAAVRVGATTTIKAQLSPATARQRADLTLLALDAPARSIAGKASASPAPPATFDLRGRFAGPFNTEAYDHIDENPVPSRRGGSAVDVLDRRRHRVIRQRAALPQRRAAAARRRGAHRRAGQLFPLRLSAAELPNEPFSVTTELAECPWNPKHRLALIGLQGREMPTNGACRLAIWCS